MSFVASKQILFYQYWCSSCVTVNWLFASFLVIVNDVYKLSVILRLFFVFWNLKQWLKRKQDVLMLNGVDKYVCL